ncbi:MAG: hypothetical protein GY929_13965 [Actinomycetia bacterium]|nr:hypothetical protein [Actinomycetes bacterium]
MEINTQAVLGATEESGVEHSDELVAMVDAIAIGDPDGIAVARAALVDAIGEQAAVDAIAVCSNFHMMTRIADGTGTPLDAGSAAISGELRADLGIDDLVSARLGTP